MTDTYIRDAENIWNDFKRRSSSDAKFKALSSEAQLNFYQKNRSYIVFIVLTILGVVLSYFGALYFKDGINYLYYVPFNKGFTISPFLDAGVDWIWETFFYYLNAFNVWLITSVLVPMKNAYLGMPVISTFILVMGAGYIIGGVRSALIVGSLVLFIALSEIKCSFLPE